MYTDISFALLNQYFSMCHVAWFGLCFLTLGCVKYVCVFVILARVKFESSMKKDVKNEGEDGVKACQIHPSSSFHSSHS